MFDKSGPVDLVLSKQPHEKSSGFGSDDLVAHVMYVDPFPFRLAGNCWSKNVRTMLKKYSGGPSNW